MQYSNSILFGLAFWPLVGAHMFMANPPALKSASNKNTLSPDLTLDSALKADGSDYPCKGYHKLLGTPEGAVVASWAAGSSQNFTLEGPKPHGGGSCQASLSFDGGKCFKVIKSFIGDCPASSGGNFSFTIPSGVPSNPAALFAWTWFSRDGKREMYMNCAVISITNDKQGGKLDSLPEVFKADIGNGCSTAADADVVFPNPGGDVTFGSNKMASPLGTCQQATPGGAQLSSKASGLGKLTYISSSAAPFPMSNATDVVNSPTGSAAVSSGFLAMSSFHASKFSTMQSKSMAITYSGSRLVTAPVLIQPIATSQTTSPSAIRTSSVPLAPSGSTSPKASQSTPIAISLTPSGSPQSTNAAAPSTPSATPQSSGAVTSTTPSATPSSTKVLTLTTQSMKPSDTKVLTITTPSPKSEAPKSEPPKSEPPKSEPPKPTPAPSAKATLSIKVSDGIVVTITPPSSKSEVPKSEAPKSEPPKSEPPKSEPPKSEPPKSEPPKLEPPKSESPKPTPAAPAKPSSSSFNPYPYPKGYNPKQRRQYTG